MIIHILDKFIKLSRADIRTTQANAQQQTKAAVRAWRGNREADILLPDGPKRGPKVVMLHKDGSGAAGGVVVQHDSAAAHLNAYSSESRAEKRHAGAQSGGYVQEQQEFMDAGVDAMEL